MRRIILMLKVVAFVTALMAVSALPAFARHGDPGENQCDAFAHGARGFAHAFDFRQGEEPPAEGPQERFDCVPRCDPDATFCEAD